ncbi:hypothetical protein [Zeimonas arvi]|uniref:Uncharacterized protein n=1 Tax=Zeimonas arvi TaxID=2498847 RepID=A0A5C8NXT7_9BURK|nr:hypothetical protein [Zeimonas arvi]TXL65996.1 hypothetical protein FHP08_07920 [Zeimonas arvi]
MKTKAGSVKPGPGAERRKAGRTHGGGRLAGQSLAEYLVVLSLVSMALAAGPNSPLEQVFDALGDRYQRFTAEVSKP